MNSLGVRVRAGSVSRGAIYLFLAVGWSLLAVLYWRRGGEESAVIEDGWYIAFLTGQYEGGRTRMFLYLDGTFIRSSSHS